jgi:hypothetical protein
MQMIFDAGVDANEYQRLDKDFAFPDLTGALCPQCSEGVLKKHGYYKRYLLLLFFAGIILVRRFRCASCGRTVSLLPSFAHPGRACGIKYIICALSFFYADDRSAMASVRGFAAKTLVGCSRQLLRHFRKRFERNLPTLIRVTAACLSPRAPPMKEKDIIKRGKQYLECVRRLNPEDVSKKIFEHSRMTYLSPLPSP